MSILSALQESILAKYNEDKPFYEKFGQYVLDQVDSALKSIGENPELFFEIPPRYRLKSDGSLIQKALYREKEYADPYKDITDKVGVRFVVLFTDRIKIVDTIIEKIPSLIFSKDRDFKEEQKEFPIAFMYQSDHYIVRPKDIIELDGYSISKDFCCEIQVRSLMQHAYAQITHDVFYKPSVVIDDPIMQRQVARCMALMEIADEKFNEFNNYNKDMESEMTTMLKCLKSQYSDKLGRQVKIDLQFDKTMLWDLDKNNLISVDSVQEFYASLKGQKAAEILVDCLDRTRMELYKHASAMFVVYLLRKGSKEKKQLIENWGFNKRLLEEVFSDFGESLDGFLMS